MAGTLNKRSRDDENMLLAIRNATPGSHRYCIVDARPKINAVANMVGRERERGENIEVIMSFNRLEVVGTRARMPTRVASSILWILLIFT